MLIAGDDEVDLRGDSAGQDVIVVGVIGHDARHGDRGDNERYAAQIIDDALRGEAGFLEARGELIARQYIEQFRQERFAGAKLKRLRPGRINQAPRRAWGEDARHQRIRVEHDAHGQAWLRRSRRAA